MKTCNFRTHSTSTAIRLGRTILVRLLPVCTAALLAAAGLCAQAPPRTVPVDPLRQFNASIEALVRKVTPSVVQIIVNGYGPVAQSSRGNADVVMVGVNTFILTQSGGNEGLGFAIPSFLVSEAIPQLRKYGHIHQGEIGMYVQTITADLAAGLKLPRDSGVIISDVQPGGPAQKAGLEVGDIVLSVDGDPVDSLPVLEIYLFRRAGGEHIKLTALRGSQTLTFDVPVVERPHNVDLLAGLTDPAKNLILRLGILGIPVNDQTAALLPELRYPSGVIVAAHAANAADSGSPLQIGDVIHAINGKPVSDLTGIRAALDSLPPNAPAVLQVERDQQLTYISLQLE